MSLFLSKNLYPYRAICEDTKSLKQPKTNTKWQNTPNLTHPKRWPNTPVSPHQTIRIMCRERGEWHGADLILGWAWWWGGESSANWKSRLWHFIKFSLPISIRHRVRNPAHPRWMKSRCTRVSIIGISSVTNRAFIIRRGVFRFLRGYGWWGAWSGG